MAEKEVTIYDIAKKLNISSATVSRGLKDHPAINKTTRKKITGMAREMGYRSNNFASSLRSRKTNTIGIIVPRLNSYFTSSAIAGMESITNQKGYNLIITQSLESFKREIENAHTMFNNRVDGLIVSLASDTENTDHFQSFFHKNIPVIFFDRTVETDHSLSIVINNFKAGYDITKHLLEQGCRRIVHLSGNAVRSLYTDRLNGYKKALEEYNIPYDESLVIVSNLSQEAGEEAGAFILNMTEKPDGIFAANDTSALYCMLHLKKTGIKIPEDIAVAGFNNDPITQIVEPNLTTVNYSGYEMGKNAALHLLQHLNGQSDIQITNSIILRSDLIIRESSNRSKT